MRCKGFSCGSAASNELRRLTPAKGSLITRGGRIVTRSGDICAKGDSAGTPGAGGARLGFVCELPALRGRRRRDPEVGSTIKQAPKIGLHLQELKVPSGISAWLQVLLSEAEELSGAHTGVCLR